MDGQIDACVSKLIGYKWMDNWIYAEYQYNQDQ